MLAREFMRLCALEALAPSGTPDGGPWPTLAGRYVFDTRLDPIDDLDPSEQRPVISVYTEDEELTKIAQAGPIFHKSTVDLVFEIAVLAKFQEADSDQLVVDYADTDAALEALIGSIDFQIYQALHNGPSGALFRKLAKPPAVAWHSTTKRDGEEAYRLARRTIITKFDLREFVYRVAPTTPLTGLGRLPDALQPIAAGLSNSTYRTALVLGIANAAPIGPTPRNELVTVGITATAGQGGETFIAGEADNLNT
jgi:hypothetical protein